MKTTDEIRTPLNVLLILPNGQEGNITLLEQGYIYVPKNYKILTLVETQKLLTQMSTKFDFIEILKKILEFQEKILEWSRGKLLKKAAYDALNSIEFIMKRNNNEYYVVYGSNGIYFFKVLHNTQ